MPKQSLNPAIRTQVTSFASKWGLTPREAEILGLLAVGTTRIKEVAGRLNLSPNTVNNHVNSIFAKTKTRSKSELLALILLALAEEIQELRAPEAEASTRSEVRPIMTVTMSSSDTID